MSGRSWSDAPAAGELLRHRCLSRRCSERPSATTTAAATVGGEWILRAPMPDNETNRRLFTRIVLHRCWQSEALRAAPRAGIRDAARLTALRFTRERSLVRTQPRPS